MYEKPTITVVAVSHLRTLSFFLHDHNPLFVKTSWLWHTGMARESSLACKTDKSAQHIKLFFIIHVPDCLSPLFSLPNLSDPTLPIPTYKLHVFPARNLNLLDIFLCSFCLLAMALDSTLLRLYLSVAPLYAGIQILNGPWNPWRQNVFTNLLHGWSDW